MGKKTNADILWMEKDDDCLDFEDILEDKVITHLDNVKDNITKDGVYKKKNKGEKDAKKRIMRGRRLSKVNKIPEMPKDKSWKESDEDPFAVKLFEEKNIQARNLKVAKE